LYLCVWGESEGRKNAQQSIDQSLEERTTQSLKKKKGEEETKKKEKFLGKPSAPTSSLNNLLYSSYQSVSGLRALT
jgi:hypothetical protein